MGFSERIISSQNAIWYLTIRQLPNYHLMGFTPTQNFISPKETHA